jgi:peptide/nickel transport system permease protein
VVIVFMLVFYIAFDFSVELDMDRRLEPPSDCHLAGTDGLGRDLLCSVVYGTGISLLIGCSVVCISATVGTILGLISGFLGGIVDFLIMRMVDIILSFPGILLAVALISFLKSSVVVLIVILVIPGWVSYARIVRGEILKNKNQEFIMAAKSYNASFFKIVFSHLLPLVIPYVIVQASLAVGGVILAESSLNFLGIGLDPEIPTLGQLINSGRSHMFDRPGLILIPGSILFVIVISFNFIGEGLNRIFNR